MCRDELQAIKCYCAMIFRFASGNLRGKEMAEILIKAKEKMKNYADSHKGPFIISIAKNGELNPVNIS